MANLQSKHLHDEQKQNKKQKRRIMITKNFLSSILLTNLGIQSMTYVMPLLYPSSKTTKLS